MKAKKLVLALAVAAFAIPASAQSLEDIIGKTGSVITNVVEGVFSKSDLTIDDIAGQWTSSGPAVTFQSDNLLKKAGGVATAAAIETKLEPYYKQYGLNGTVITIQHDGTFTMQVKKLTLKGTITQDKSEKGIFHLKFNILGMNLGDIKTYVQKTSSSMDIMFDATKMKTLISAIAGLSNNNLASALSKLLDSYDGMCVGFKLSKTADVSNGGNNATNNSNAAKSSDNSGLGTLMDILKKK